MTRTQKVLYAAAVLCALSGIGVAIKPLIAVGYRLTSQSTTPLGASHSGIWLDSFGRLRVDDGSAASQKMAYCDATATGDMCIFGAATFTTLPVGTNGQVLTADSGETTGMKWAAGGGGSGYATIKDEGSSLTQRATANFIGAGVTCVDNSGSTRTDCTIPATVSSVATGTGLSGGAITTTGTIGVVVPWSEVDAAIFAPSYATTSAGSYTVATKFIPTRKNVVVNGVRCYNALGAKTIKVTLWDATTDLGHTDVSAGAAAEFSGTFSPVTLSAYTVYYVSQWVKDGSGFSTMTVADYNAHIAASPNGTITALLNGPIMRLAAAYNVAANGDTKPDTDNTSSFYLCEPLFQ